SHAEQVRRNLTVTSVTCGPKNPASPMSSCG
ncbi:uncharacterized protein METZ01_LOCUS373667, partial [marine metagenome]